MKRKNIKPLVISALTALCMGSMSVAGTFALFTDLAQTQVNIQAGIVDVNMVMSDLEFYELNNNEKITATDDNGALINSIGGTAKLDGNTLTLDNWAPGDHIKMKATATNLSNVKVKMRLKAILSGEMASALVLKVSDASYQNLKLAAQGAGTLVSDWQELNVGSNPDNLGIEVSFPNIGEEITERTQGENNQYQGKTATLKVIYEFVQGNADVQNSLLEKANSVLSTNSFLEGDNKTMYEALEDLSDLKADILDAGYVWGYEQDRFFETSSVPTGQEYKYFKAMSADDNSGYSVYAKSNWAATDVTLFGRGFDAGDSSVVGSVSYNGLDNNPRTNVIRTDGGTLHLDAIGDTIKHYGASTLVTIENISKSSYFECGSANLIEIANGRLVITDEEETYIGAIYLEAVNDSFTDNDGNGSIVLAAMENAMIPSALYRDAITAPEGGQDAKLIATIQQVDSQGVPQGTAEKISLYGEETAYEESKQYTGVSDLGSLVLEASAASGNPSNAIVVEEEDKEEVIAGASRFAGGEGTQANPFMIVNASNMKSLYEDIESTNGTQGKYYKLGADFALYGGSAASPENYQVTVSRWELTGAAAFKGYLNGDNHTISFSYKGASSSIISLFGNMNGATLRDLKVNVDIDNSLMSEYDNEKKWQWVATIGVETVDCVFNNVDITGSIKNRSDIGGFCINSTRGQYVNCDVALDLHNIDGRTGMNQTSASNYVFIAGFEAQCGANTTFTNCSYSGKIRLERDQLECAGPCAAGFIANQDSSPGAVLTNCTSNINVQSDFGNTFEDGSHKNQYVSYAPGLPEGLKFFAYHKDVTVAKQTIMINGEPFIRADHLVPAE